MWSELAGARQAVSPFPKTDLVEISIWYWAEFADRIIELGVIHDGGSETKWGSPSYAVKQTWHKFDVTSNVIGYEAITIIEGFTFAKIGDFYLIFGDYGTLIKEEPLGGEVAAMGAASSLPWILMKLFSKRFPKLRPLRV